MKHSQVKERIIKTASELFYRNGYNRTGINEIIAESGIAKATLYNHFKSKDDICVAYLHYKNSTFLKDIEAYCDDRSQGKDQVLGLFDFLMEFFQDRDFNGCWCIRTISEIPKENQKIKDEIQRHKRMFIALIDQLIASNGLENEVDERDNLAKKIYLLYESAVGESHLHQEDWPIRSARELCMKILE